MVAWKGDWLMELINKNNLQAWLENRMKNTVGPEHAEARKFLEKVNEEKVWFDLADRDFGNMVISVVRYALGRQTYIVQNTCDFVSNLLPVLHPITLAMLERDIANAWSYGDENIDKPHWMMLLDSITFEIERRKENSNA